MRENFRTVRFTVTIAVIAIIAGSVSFEVFAKVPQSKSTQYLYDECIDALEKSEFEDSYCATYIGAFMDGYGAASYVMASEVYKRNLQDEFKSTSDCDKKSPDDLKELVKIFISWVDEQRASTEIQYDILRADVPETLGSMTIDELTCLNKNGERRLDVNNNAGLEMSSLENSCRELKQETGNKYEPIIGHYIEKKSLARVVESTRRAPEYSGVITLEYEGREIELHSHTMTEGAFHEQYSPTLGQVISAHINDENSKKHVYGVCGYQDKTNKYRHKIETLILIKKGE